MQILLNNFSVTLMLWETNPLKRKKSNISFYLDDKLSVEKGDVIVGEFSEYGVSEYKINKVIESRPGAVKKTIT